MKTKMIPLLAIVFSSLMLSGCLKQTGPATETEQNQKQEQVEGESFSGSLKELLGLGKRVECSWQFNDPEGKSTSQGVVYVDGKRSRSELSIQVAGEAEMGMDMIQVSDGEMMYMWNRGEKTGSKFDIAEMEKLGQEMQEEYGENQSQNQAQSDLEKMYDYKCKAWRVDGSKFEIPADIEFTDMMAEMNQVQEQMENMNQNMRSGCDHLPEPERSRCQQSPQ